METFSLIIEGLKIIRKGMGYLMPCVWVASGVGPNFGKQCLMWYWLGEASQLLVIVGRQEADTDI